ncbi:MAG: putative 50S ribosomal subunit protein L18 [Candidatus Hodgkinia cicadicola]|nr:MAG: putative 50S ribosomal subunit protein L18 [Candidatus Hodgkinia cicadicola]
MRLNGGFKSVRPCLYFWRSSSWYYAQVVDKSVCLVVAAARAPASQRTRLAKQLAARCLAVGVFELRYVNRHVGSVLNVLTSLRTLGISV